MSRSTVSAPPESTRATPRVLVVEDDPNLRRTLVGLLSTCGFDVQAEPDGVRALRTLQRQDVDVVLTDLVMPGAGGHDLLQQVQHAFPWVPVIVMTSFGSVESAVSLMQAGAVEYLSKPLQLDPLVAALHRVLDATRMRRERARATRDVAPQLRLFMGTSRVMRELFDQVGRVAVSSAPVLITGETGTGKELIAQAVHRTSGRKSFVPVNCGAIPPGLLESELFGHVRGAFTGAERDQPGLFEAADGGTIFLDEIGELPLALQSKLLRVLQSGELRRVGDVASRHVDVRLIAATHRDLAAAIIDGSFRDDLYYRINVLQLHVPPLRERADDIPLLADQFLADVAARDGSPAKRITPAALALLAGYEWPGNVRELRNAIERLAVMTDAQVIDVGDLPGELRGVTPASPALARLGDELSLADLEREHVLAVIARCGGNRTRAAKALGMPRRTLYRRLAEYGLLDPNE